MNSVRCPHAPQRQSDQFSSKILTIICDNFETVRGRMSVSINQLISNRKSHTGFLLVPISVTLNDLERRNSTYFALFHRIR